MSRKYVPSTPATRGEPEPDVEVDETPDQGDQPTAPAESETRDTLEAFAVEHAGLTEDEAKAFANKGELHAAITAALATLNS